MFLFSQYLAKWKVGENLLKSPSVKPMKPFLEISSANCFYSFLQRIHSKAITTIATINKILNKFSGKTSRSKLKGYMFRKGNIKTTDKKTLTITMLEDPLRDIIITKTTAINKRTAKFDEKSSIKLLITLLNMT